ncbi:MAG: hypothetical protein Q9187_006621, partial [Circinaria calcarea]
MQAPQSSQRSNQRRSPAVDPNLSAAPSGPVPNIPSSAQGSVGTGPRSSSGSAKSSSIQRRNPSQQLSQIEKSVTHLLIATKQLLETLTQWSRHTATEGEVSDVYVRLGYEFNIACRAFTAIGVETADLGPVPDLLRAILEDTLSQDASPASLDRFLPRIRDIIISLLHGLKRKQQRLRARHAKETPGGSNSQATRQLSVGSIGSGETGITQILEDVPSNRTTGRVSERRNDSANSFGDEFGVPPRTSSVSNGVASPLREDIGFNASEQLSHDR